MQIFSGSCYIYTYEGVRHLCTKYGAGKTVKSFLAGGCASLVGQTLIVPFDVISQHMMVLGMGTHGLNPLGIRTHANESKFRLTVNIAKEIYRRDGFIGFYRGYLASLMAYVPNSAMWWSFYHLYQGEFVEFRFLLRKLMRLISGGVDEVSYQGIRDNDVPLRLFYVPRIRGELLQSGAQLFHQIFH